MNILSFFVQKKRKKKQRCSSDKTLHSEVPLILVPKLLIMVIISRPVVLPLEISNFHFSAYYPLIVSALHLIQNSSFFISLSELRCLGNMSMDYSLKQEYCFWRLSSKWTYLFLTNCLNLIDILMLIIFWTGVITIQSVIQRQLYIVFLWSHCVWPPTNYLCNLHLPAWFLPSYNLYDVTTECLPVWSAGPLRHKDESNLFSPF